MANKTKKKSTKAAKLTKGSVKANKYSKLMTVASKELADKKKALVKAEKALATAHKNHSELLAEVARLDMVERSLKALVEGTEVPQNVRYVYSYPQWVWTYPYQWWGGNPYGWWWNGNTWTVSLGSPQTYVYNSGNLQGGQFTTTNALNTTTVPAVDTSGALTCGSSSGLSFSNCSNAGSLPLATSSSSPSFAMTTTNSPSTHGQPEITVDLSTGATEEPQAEAEAETAPETEAVNSSGYTQY